MAKMQQKNNSKATYGNNQFKKSEKKDKYQKEDNLKNYFLVPIFLIIAVIPLIVKIKSYDTNLSQFKWYPDNDSILDVFLYYKQWFVIFIAGFMILIIAFKMNYNRKELRFSPIFIPLVIYAFFIIVSTFFSKYPSYSITGSYEQFESVFVLLGYCIITFYSYLFVRTENDLKLFTYIVIGATLVMSTIGLMQFTGYDIFTTEAGRNLISPGGESIDLSLNFEKGRVYLTLYNPNYVGVYAALFIPILIVLTLFIKNIKLVILSILGIIGLTVSVIGSLSLTGFICIIISMVFFIILMRRYLIKRLYITLPVFVILIVSLLVMNSLTDRYIENKFKSMLQFEKTEYNTTDMETNDSNISLTYKGNNLYVKYQMNDENTATIIPYDDSNNQIEGHYDDVTKTVQLVDERFQGINIGFGNSVGEFYILIDGVKYNFINHIEDNTYYYINLYGKYDKIASAPSAIFTGYESFASNRGYIWSRTLPLLKDHIILGSGPDTYTMVFPQNDYLYLANAGFEGLLLTKPHSLYLQIAVQTGVLSLIAFLVFYGMYFVSSIQLYIKERFISIYARVGIAIFIGSISYMIAGITNDSSITTAPIFWAIIGVGISVNHKAKDLLKKEMEEEKASRVSPL